MITDAFTPADPEVLDDLRRRVREFRSVPRIDPGDDRGVASAWLERLLEAWAGGYDWRRHEERLASRSWVQSETAVPVRAILQPGPPGAPVVLLLHGWPDSVLRFERILDRVPEATLIAPALPGFPLAAPTAEGAFSAIELADAVAAAMVDFGVDRYVISAGDVGCDVAEAIAARHPHAVRALHLTDVSQYHFLQQLPADLDAEERSYVERGRRWQAAEGGYMHEQSSRPDTLSVGLGDSPAGLLAWIGEKLLRWTDRAADGGPAFTDEELLTWVTAYWVSGAIGTSFAPYALGGGKPWPRIEAPAVFTVFPADLVNAPRRFAERAFTVADWREFDRGGHFAAWEHPEAYLWGVRRALEVAAAA